MNFMTKDELITRLQDMKDELFAVEERLHVNGTLEIIISIDRQPPKESIDIYQPIKLTDEEEEARLRGIRNRKSRYYPYHT